LNLPEGISPKLKVFPEIAQWSVFK